MSIDDRSVELRDPHLRIYLSSHLKVRRVVMRIITILQLREGDENWPRGVCQTDHPENHVAVELHTDAAWGYRVMVLVQAFTILTKRVS